MTRWSKILIGVDDSEASLRAARVGWELAERADADGKLVHVTADVTYYPPGPMMAPVVETQEFVTSGAQARMEKALGGYVPDAALASLDVTLGAAAWALPEYAERYGYDLIVLGGKHHTGVVRMLGGSIAHHLIRTMDRSLLISNGETLPRRITAAIDLGKGSDLVLDEAEYLADLTGAELRLVHVIEPLNPVTVPDEVFDHTQFADWSRKAFEERVGARFSGCEHEVLIGAAGDELLRDVAKSESDLLVIGSHGKGFIDRMLIGSVTHRLVTSLPSSLLVVPIAAAASDTRGKREQAA